jgi:hypothetical protein
VLRSVVSWDQATRLADDPEGMDAYHEAVIRLGELDVLVQSFAEAVIAAGKWPTLLNELTGKPYPVQLKTYLRNDRHVTVWVRSDQELILPFAWTLQSNQDGVYFSRDRISIGRGHTPEAQIASDTFEAGCNLVKAAMQWAPADLVSHLRNEGIPIPEDH